MQRITIAIMALGGQGGGVLANWISAIARTNGYVSQVTSVPGVAQRTGTTIYYIEMSAIDALSRDPVLALAPMPGDVDVVVSSELMEAGRAMVRGFVTPDRTTLVTSTHRIYAISEKSAKGDGSSNSEAVLAAAKRKAKNFIGFDMQAAADGAGTVISAVMLGALARSNALPFHRSAFEDAIRAEGKAVDANLRGFAAGWVAPSIDTTILDLTAVPAAEPTSAHGRALKARITASLPAPAHRYAAEGVRRLLDYQDLSYAELYLDRLEVIAKLDGPAQSWRLTVETARHLALWMSYEDTIRVADLKIRAERTPRIRSEVRAKDDQVVEVTEFMHPRLQEVAEMFPAGIGRALLKSSLVARASKPLFGKGRFVKTTSVGWFLALWCVAGLRGVRRASLRYHEENGRIERWLADISLAAISHPEAAVELIKCQGLIKGYGDTHERGLNNFALAVGAFSVQMTDTLAASAVRDTREAILASTDAGEEPPASRVPSASRRLAHDASGA